MRTYFSAPMVMLFAICALVVFFEHSEAGTPVVDYIVEATACHAKAQISCGITGSLTNKECYSGSAYCYARITTESGRSSYSISNSIWAEVYKSGWWPFRKLKVRTSPTVSAIVFADNASSSYAYARGTLGCAYERDSVRYPE